jgi:hypothetical protein
MSTDRRFITRFSLLASTMEVLVDTDYEGRLVFEASLRDEGQESAYYVLRATRSVVSKNTDRLADAVIRALLGTTCVVDVVELFKGSDLWMVSEHDQEALNYYAGI